MNSGKERSPILVAFLTIITCGIYGLVWFYQITEEIQREEKKEESMSPGIELLLILVTCGLYTYFWYYKYAKKLHIIQSERDFIAPDDNGILYIILAVLGLSVVSMAIMQSSMNRVWKNEKE